MVFRPREPLAVPQTERRPDWRQRLVGDDDVRAISHRIFGGEPKLRRDPAESEHSVGICSLIGHDLQHVPVFHDLALIIEPEDVDAGPYVITGPILATMKDHVVALGEHSFEFHTLAGVIASGFLEIGDEPFLAVSNTWIVLDVLLARIPLNRLPRATLIEHEVV